LVPNTGLPSFTNGPGFASGVGEEGLDVDPFRLFSISPSSSASNRLDRSGVGGFDLGKVGSELHKCVGEPDELARRTPVQSSGVPVTVSGVVKASSPESLSFTRSE